MDVTIKRKKRLEQLLELENNVEKARANLAYVMGMDVGTPIEPVDVVVVLDLCGQYLRDIGAVGPEVIEADCKKECGER